MDTAKTVHLFNVAHYGAFSPFLARHAVALDQNAYEQGIRLPPGHTHCERCGVSQVPGLTSSVRVVYKAAARARKAGSRGKKPGPGPGGAGVLPDPAGARAGEGGTGRGPTVPRQRTLRTTCLSCRHQSRHALLTRKAVAHSEPSSGGPGGKKKKKKKRTELAAMLAEKREQGAGLQAPLLQFMP